MMRNEFDKYSDPEDRLSALGEYLHGLALEQVAKRQNLEQRWLDDLEQYQGKYDASTQQRLNANPHASKAFNNITRPKVNAAAARLSDMLLPNDDRNFSIQPTPVPQLQNLPIEQAEQLMTLARQRANAMQDEIDDQLTEADYQTVMRDAIRDGCLFGTGILKAPVIVEQTIKGYQDMGQGVYALQLNSEIKPTVERVAIWDFFPDMSATEIKDCEFIFQRHYLSRSQLRDLRKQQGYSYKQIRKAMESDPDKIQTEGTHLARLKELSDLQGNNNDNRYVVWEYHGWLGQKELEICGCEFAAHDDPDEPYSAVVVFCNGVVLKASLSTLETGDFPYSVFIYEKDDTSIFGFGVACLLRSEQRVANAAWRMMLDNAALTVKPQIILNEQLVEPDDNFYAPTPGKVWRMRDEGRSVHEVFAAFDIPNHQERLVQIHTLARQMADDVTTLPMLAQGEQGNAPDTATGMSMLLNSANTVLRRIVKQFDDGITKPIIQRFYHWNMEYNDKAEIKGDFAIDARGSSALLVKETQNQALQQLMQIATQPIYSDLTKHAALFRKTVQSMHIAADDVIKTDEELAAQNNAPSPEQQQQQAMLQAQLQKTQAEIDRIRAETTVKNVDGLFSSISAAKEVAILPAIAPMADEVYQSAGGKDYNGYPIVQPPTGEANGEVQRQGQGWRQTLLTPENTHPQYPPNADVGMMSGIDKTNM